MNQNWMFLEIDLVLSIVFGISFFIFLNMLAQVMDVAGIIYLCYIFYFLSFFNIYIGAIEYFNTSIFIRYL